MIGVGYVVSVRVLTRPLRADIPRPAPARCSRGAARALWPPQHSPGADFFDLSAPRADGADRPLTTGSLGLDLIATGLPRGGITEYAGIDGAGKESLALAAVVACQQSGGGALLVDADNAGDFDALAAASVNLDALVLACPTTAAEAWHILTAVSAADALDLVVLFSLSALLGFPDSGWGAHRLPQHLTRLVTTLRHSRTAVLLTNHPIPASWVATQEAASGLGCPWRTAGGDAIAQAARLRIALEPAGVRMTAWGDLAAVRAVATVVKHRGQAHAPRLPLEIGLAGPDRCAELVALGLSTDCLHETALGLALDDAVPERSAERAAVALAAQPDLADALERRIRAAWGATPRLDAIERAESAGLR